MISFIKIIIVIILSASIFHAKSFTDAQLRLGSAIFDVSNQNSEHLETAAILLALVENESAWDENVLNGRCDLTKVGSRCDYDKTTNQFRARGPFQVWKWCSGAWSTKNGSVASFTEGARCARDLISSGIKRCGSLLGAFNAYRGLRCSTNDERSKDYVQSYVKFKQLLSQHN